VSYAAVSLLVGLNSLAAAVGNILFGLSTDRWRLGYLTLVLASALTVLAMSLIGVIPNYWLLGSVMLVGAFACGAFHPPAFDAAGAASHPRRHEGISIVMTAGIVACGVGPIVVSQAVSRGGLRATPWCIPPGLALVAVAAVLLWPAPERGGVAAAVQHEPSHASGVLPDPGPCVLLLFANSALRAYAHMGIIVILSYLAEQRWHLSVAASGWSIGILSVGSGLGGLLGARWTQVGGERRTMLWLAPLSLVALIPMAFTSGYGWYPWLFLYGLTLNGPGPLIIGLAQRLVPQRSALVSGLLVGPTFAVAASLASVTTPFLVARFGQAATMALLAVPVILAWVAAFGLPTRLPPEATVTPEPQPGACGHAGPGPGRR
jgi:FSR family fosmidomycin resistance protein-like MFS transporter